MTQNKIELRKVRDFGGLLNVIFEYIKINFKSLLKSNLLIGAPTILLAGVFLGIYQSSLFSFDVDSTDSANWSAIFTIYFPYYGFLLYYYGCYIFSPEGL